MAPGLFLRRRLRADGTGVLHAELCPLLPLLTGPLGQLANGTLGPRPPGGSQPASRLVTQRPRPRACRAARCVSENREAFRLLETDRWMDSLTTALLEPGGTRLDGGRAALQVGGWESAESGSSLRPWMQITPQEAVPSGLSEAQWPQGGGTGGLSCLLALISQTQQQPHPPRKGDGQRPAWACARLQPSCSSSFLVPRSADWESALWLRRLCCVLSPLHGEKQVFRRPQRR